MHAGVVFLSLVCFSFLLCKKKNEIAPVNLFVCVRGGGGGERGGEVAEENDSVGVGGGCACVKDI